MKTKLKKINSDFYTNLKEEIRKDRSVYSWYSFSDTVLKADLQLVSVNQIKKEITLIPIDETSEYYLEKTFSGDGKINLFFDSLGAVVITELIEYGAKKSLKVKMPKEYSELERREDGRIEAQVDIWVQFKFEDQLIKKRCFDIGMGGFSLMFSKNEIISKKLQISTEMDFEIILFKINIGVEGEVKKINKLKLFQSTKHPYATSRISFEFINLSDKNQLVLNDFISGHRDIMVSSKLKSS